MEIYQIYFVLNLTHIPHIFQQLYQTTTVFDKNKPYSSLLGMILFIETWLNLDQLENKKFYSESKRKSQRKTQAWPSAALLVVIFSLQEI